MFASMKNTLIIDALNGKIGERIPVWMMRQAGRTLPEYLELRKQQNGFKSMVQSPEFASEATVQPLNRYQLDAAILFSDILVIPEALGFDYEVIEKVGPSFNNTLGNTKLNPFEGDIESSLDYVGEAIKKSLEKIDNRVPLLGFAGAPFTILCYMVEGGGSKTFSNTRKLLYSNPKLAHQYLGIIADITAKYLDFKVKSGVEAIQLFDSWAGILSPELYTEFGTRYIQQVLDKMTTKVPRIIFAKGAWFALDELSKIDNANCLGIDWNTPIDFALNNTNQKVLQGNLDPAMLYADKDTIVRETISMLEKFKKRPYIANLGHGIYPDVDFNKAQVFIDTVKNYKI